MQAYGGRGVIQFHHVAAEQQHPDGGIFVAGERAGFNDHFLGREFEAGKGNGHAGPQVG